MSKKFITFSATALTALTLINALFPSSVFASEVSQQITEHQKAVKQVIPVNDEILKVLINRDLNLQNGNWDRTPIQDITYEDLQNIETLDTNKTTTFNDWVQNNSTLQSDTNLQKQCQNLVNQLNTMNGTKIFHL